MAGFGTGPRAWRGASSGIPLGRQLFTLNQNVHIPPHLQPEMMAIDALGQQAQSKWFADKQKREQEKQARAAEQASAELFAQTPAVAQYNRQIKELVDTLRDSILQLLTIPGFPVQVPEDRNHAQWLWDIVGAFYEILNDMNQILNVSNACTVNTCPNWYIFNKDALSWVQNNLPINEGSSNEMRHKQLVTLQNMVKTLLDVFSHMYAGHRETFVSAGALPSMIKIFNIFVPFAIKFDLLDAIAQNYLKHFIELVQEEACLPKTGEVTRSRAFPRMTLNE